MRLAHDVLRNCKHDTDQGHGKRSLHALEVIRKPNDCAMRLFSPTLSKLLHVLKSR